MDETPNYKLAEADYVAGMKYKNIADKYAVSLSTVKSWKTRYGWSRKSMRTKVEKVCVQNKKYAYKNKEAIADDVEHVVNNDLTDKQRLFCLHYVNLFNATKAYQKAFPDASYQTSMVNGWQLLQTDKIKDAINQLKQNKLNREMLKEEDIFQWYLDIARSNITDFMEFGNEEIEVTDKQGNDFKIKVSSVNIKQDHEVDGTLISEISKGKDGVKVKLLDKMRAMDWLTTHTNMATEKQVAELEVLRSKLSVDKDTPIQITFTKAGERHGGD